MYENTHCGRPTWYFITLLSIPAQKSLPVCNRCYNMLPRVLYHCPKYFPWNNHDSGQWIEVVRTISWIAIMNMVRWFFLVHFAHRFSGICVHMKGFRGSPHANQFLARGRRSETDGFHCCALFSHVIISNGQAFTENKHTCGSYHSIGS